MMPTDTLKTIKKLILLTFVFLTVSFIVFGAIVLLVVLKLNQVSAHAFGEFLDEMGWGVIVELREESLDRKTQMAQLEEHIGTLVTVMNQCSDAANLCNESSRECGVSANDSRTATGKLEDEIRGLRQASGKAYEVVGMLDEENKVLAAKVGELSAYTTSLDKALDNLETSREKVLEEALQPMKNSLLALRKENVQLHRTSAELIKSLEEGDEDLHEFLLEVVHGISTSYRSHADKKRIT